MILKIVMLLAVENVVYMITGILKIPKLISRLKKIPEKLILFGWFSWYF